MHAGPGVHASNGSILRLGPGQSSRPASKMGSAPEAIRAAARLTSTVANLTESHVLPEIPTYLIQIPY